MTGQSIAAAMMFFITIGFTALFWLPALKFMQKNELVKFYWMGLWGFISGLAALAGAQAVLIILGQDVQRFATAILFGVTSAFVLFVVFAWGRLTLKGVSAVVKKVK